MQGFLLFIGIEVISVTVTTAGILHMNLLQSLAVLFLHPVDVFTKMVSDTVPRQIVKVTQAEDFPLVTTWIGLCINWLKSNYPLTVKAGLKGKEPWRVKEK